MVNGRGWKLLFTTIALGMVATAQAQTTRCLTKYEPIEVAEFDCGGRGPAICDQFTGIGAEAVFQEPGFSGSTDGVLPGLQGVQDFPVNWARTVPTTGDFTGLLSPSYEYTIAWGDPTDTTTAGVRATTQSVANFPSPSVHLQGKIRFDIAVTAFEFNFLTNSFGAQVTSDAGILVALSLKETGNSAPLGDADTGTGDLELVYRADSAIIPAATNGFFATALPGQFLPIGGYRVMASAEAWPPDLSEWETLEFDLAAIDADMTTNLVLGFPGGVDGDAVVTSGDGMLDATSNGGGVNRGILDAIIFTPDPDNTAGQYFFIYIDNIEFDAPVDDPFLVVPSVNGPITATAPGTGTVTVDSIFNLCDGTGASSVELFIDGGSVGSVAPVSGIATFNSILLTTGDLVTAKQTRASLTSDFSLPVEVFGPGVALADNFDSYADQADLNELWLDSIGSPTPADAKLLLTAGGAASCPNFLKEDNPAGANAARLYRPLGGAVNGSNDDPLWATWNFKFTEDTTLNGRTRFELARFDSGTFTTGARSEGTAGITMFNQIAGELASQYNLTLRVTDNTALAASLTSNGWTLSAGNYRVGSGVSREINTWHKMQIEVKSDVINYYIDDVNVNPDVYSNGVPRPNGSGYTHVIIGEGFSNNDPVMFYDNVSVTIGSNGESHPFDPPVSNAPGMQTPLFPGLASVNLTGISTNATEVIVIANDITTIGEVTTTGFAVTTLNVPVTPLVFEDLITAIQIVDGERSCASEAVQVVVPAVVIVEDVLEPGDTVVTVSGLEENLAEKIKVYANGATLIGTVGLPTTDPVAVTVTPLVENDTITAKQTIGGEESLPSNSVLVRFRPPFKLSVTLSLDEDGNLGAAPADYEWVGAASATGSAPHGKPLLPQTGVWQEFVFSLVPGEEPVTDFAHFGSVGLPGGELNPDGGDYNIDSIFFSIDSNGPVSAGPYTLYVDHIYYKDSLGNKVLISDAESSNPFPNVRGQSTSCLPDDLNCIGNEQTGIRTLDGDTSIDGSQSVRLEWKWPNENANNTFAVWRPTGPTAVFADDATSVGFYVLFNDFTTNAVAAPDLVEPNIGDVDFVRVQNVDSNALSVGLYRNGTLFDTEIAAGSTVDFDVSGITDEVLDQYAARQTTTGGTSEIGFPRGITVPPPPTIVSPVAEGATTVTVDDVVVGLFNAATTAVTVSRPGPWSSATSSGFESSPVVVEGVAALSALDVLTATQTVNGLVSAPSPSVIVIAGFSCVVSWSDDFDIDSTANWTVNDGPTDNPNDFFFDYSSVGIPPAPSSKGTTRGMKLQANLTSGVFGGFSVSPTGQAFTGDYKLAFDLWANYNGPLNGGGSGSSNLSMFGVLTSGTAANWPGVVDAVWFGAIADGGSSADWRAYSPDAVVSYQDGDPEYAATTRNHTNPYYASMGGVEAPAAQVLLYPQQAGTSLTGTAGMTWHLVEINKAGNLVTWRIDDLLIATVDITGMTLGGDNILFGHSDFNSGISADPNAPALLFTLIDNVRILVPQEDPVTQGDWDGDLDSDLDDLEEFTNCLGGPGMAPDPPISGCGDSCLDTFDADFDGDLDLNDYKLLTDLGMFAD